MTDQTIDVSITDHIITDISMIEQTYNTCMTDQTFVTSMTESDLQCFYDRSDC